MTSTPIIERSRRTELAKAARREEILASARRVFAKQGFRGTTIADIAEEAGTALGTIYLYFASKEEVFAALNEQFGELIIQAMADAPAALSLDDTVRHRVRNVFETCGTNRDLVRLVVLNTDRESDVAKRLKASAKERHAPMIDAITRGMEAGLVRTADAVIMTNLVLGLVSIAVYQAYVISDGGSAAEYREACADMIVSYMTPPSVAVIAAAGTGKAGAEE